MFTTLQSPQLLLLQARSIGIDFKTECLRREIFEFPIDQTNLENNIDYYNFYF